MPRRPTLAITIVVLVVVVVATGCGTTETTPTTRSANVSTKPQDATTTEAVVAVDPVAVAAGFMRAREAGDVDTTLSYAAHDALFDWGPGGNPDTFAQGLAWQDAFGIIYALQDCTLHDATRNGSATVRCIITVDTAVNAAVGGSAGTVCVDITVADAVVTSAVLLGSRPGCTFDFWTTTFVPFNAWVRENHPESNPDDMYDNRLTPQDIARWAQYTAEFVDDHTA